jgi:hypothetical protein
LKAAPPKACTVVSVPIRSTPHNIRHRFARDLASFATETGRRYGGYVKRESATLVVAHIVTTNTQSEDDLGELWYHLDEVWGPVINMEDVTYTNNDFVNVQYLIGRFMVVQPVGEGPNWSNRDDTYDDDKSVFSVVSSIR